MVQVLQREAELRALVPEWETLAADTPEPNVFYEPWALLPALSAYGWDGLRCIAVWHEGTLAGVFPMRLERLWHGLPVPVLRSWRHRNMLACTPLVRGGSAALCIAALLQKRPAPLVEFEWIAATGPFYGALAEAACAGGFPFLVSDAFARPILTRERDPRLAYNSKMKSNLRRWQARLRGAGNVVPARLAANDDIVRWTEDFLRLEASGWKGRNGTALACREDDRRYVGELLPEAYRRGRLHITGLDLDGRPLTRHVHIAAGDGSFSFKIAYDEAHAHCSPGILGEVDNIRQFMEVDGPRWIDSNTAPENTSCATIWKDRRTIQSVALGLRGAGRLAVAGLPLLRLAKSLFVKRKAG